MPEIKHTFQGGRMNKDLDERLVPNGEYRDAMNIQVRTSDGDAAGTVQNIQGNSFVGGTILNYQPHNHTLSTEIQNMLKPDIIASVADEKSDKAYFFSVSSRWTDLFVDYWKIRDLSNYIGGSTSGSGDSITTLNGTEVPMFLTDSIFEIDCSGPNPPTPVSQKPVVIDLHGYIDHYNNVINGNYDVSSNDETDNGPSDETWTQLQVANAKYLKPGMIMEAYELVEPVEGSYDYGVINVLPDAKIKSINGNTLTFYSEQKPFEESENGFSNVSLIVFHDEGVLKFDKQTKITGINIIDDLLFWTDNKNEPRKINITRCKEGCYLVNGEVAIDSFKIPTKLKVSNPSNNNNLTSVSDLELSTMDDSLREEHITVIRKPPVYPPTLEMVTRLESEINVSISEFTFGAIENGSVLTISDNAFLNSNFRPNDVLLFSSESIAGSVELDAGDESVQVQATFLSYQDDIGENTTSITNTIKISIISLGVGYAEMLTAEWDIQVKTPKPLFELKFVRFGYRYKYEDGEYSSFSPWSELAFKPDSFDYSPIKGYNLGMVNTITELTIKDFIPYQTDRSNDVVAVEILYKTTDSPNVYTIKTITREKDPEWELFTPSSGEDPINTGELTITSEMIHRALPSNQLLRSWDNVPRYALAQEITANRLVYGNYTQGYDISFPVGLNQSVVTTSLASVDSPQKSIKSIRNYKFGIVFGDKYGRETPVLSSSLIIGDETDEYKGFTGDIIVDKIFSDTQNSFLLTQNWDSLVDASSGEPDNWMEYVKYYVKETSNEYYNLVLDRWYHAKEDLNVWLSFPSADRNKVDEETYLILKNEHGNNTPVKEKARYKIISIESEAPDFIKIKHRMMGMIELDEAAPYNGYDEGANSGGVMFSGTADTNAYSPTNLMSATEIVIPAENWNHFLDNYQGKGTLKFKIVGRTLLPDGVTVVEEISSGKWITVSHWKTLAPSSTGLSGDTFIYWDEAQGDEFDMFSQFNSQGFTLNSASANLRYFIKFKEEIVEEDPEFDGRFFVLIEKDATLEEKVQKFTSASENWADKATFKLAYIDTQKENPASVSGIYNEDGNGGNTWGGISTYEGFTGNENLYDPDGTGTPISDNANIEYFALGCHGPQNLQPAGPNSYEYEYTLAAPPANQVNNDMLVPEEEKWIRNYGTETREFWVNWSNHMDDGDSIGTGLRIFLDSAMSAYNPIANSDINESSTYAWGNSGHNYKPTGLDQGGAANGTYGRAVFSITSKEGFANPDKPMRALFKAYMTQSGTVFRFKDDPNDNYYQVISSDQTSGIHNHSSPIYADGSHWDTLTSNMTPTFGYWYTDSGSWSRKIGGHSSNPDYMIYGPGADGEAVGYNYYWWNDSVTPPFNYAAPMYGPHKVINSDDIEEEDIWAGSVYTLPFNASSSVPPMNYWEQWDYEETCGLCDLDEGSYGSASNSSSSNNSAAGYTSSTLQKYCRRHSIRTEFRKIDISTMTVTDEGIDIEAWDPRSVVNHFGFTGPDNSQTLDIVIMEKTASAGSVVVPDSDAAIWETEPKKDADLDLYYEASPSIPMILKKGNSLSFAQINSNINIIRKQEGYFNDINLSNSNTLKDFKFTDIDYVNSGEEPVFYIQSENISTGNISAHTYGISIGDLMVFNHSSGLKTRSKIEDFYQSIGIVEDNVIVDTYLLPQTRYTKTIRHASNESNGSMIHVISDNSNINVGDIVVGGDNCLGDCSDIPSGLHITSIGSTQSGTDPDYITDAAISGTDWMDQTGGATDPTSNTEYTVEIIKPTGWYKLDADVWKYAIQLAWHNCYAYGNGLESNRIRDDFNAPQIDNGVKVSTTLREYGEELRGSGLIHSGLYNSMSGVNDLNEFNMSEKITKDLNPVYGSIQALKTRENNIVVFTEDKVLKVLANKDAVYNADGNPQLVATNRTLGDATPFAGDYGISKNPESLAWDQYRLYFTDKQRGAVLRLSGDGLTPISNVGMRTWFRDNLKKTKEIVGTFDKVNGEYNVSLHYLENVNSPNTTVSFNEASKGWISFKSFITSTGVSISDQYLTSGKMSQVNPVSGEPTGEVTMVGVFRHYSDDANRNTFYNVFKESSIKLLFNDVPGSIKSFNTINYEGSQSKIGKLSTTTTSDAAGNVLSNITTGEYHNLSEKKGWYVDSFETDLQSGNVNNFINKEGKYFNYITGVSTNINNLDSSEFSVQGIGQPSKSKTSKIAYYNFRVGAAPVSNVGEGNFFDINPSWNNSISNWDPSTTLSDNWNSFLEINDPVLTNGVPEYTVKLCEGRAYQTENQPGLLWADGGQNPYSIATTYNFNLVEVSYSYAFQIQAKDVEPGTKVYFDFAADGTNFTIDDFIITDTESWIITDESENGFTGVATAELVEGGFDGDGSLLSIATWQPITMKVYDGHEGLEGFTVTLQQYDSAGNCLYDCNNSTYTGPNNGLIGNFAENNNDIINGVEDVRKININIVECTAADFTSTLDEAYKLTVKNDDNYLTEED